MSLVTNIKNYLNFSKQTNFDAKAGISPVPKEDVEKAKADAKAKAIKEVNERYKYEAYPKAPEASVAKAEPKKEDKPDNSEKIAKLNKGIATIDKNIAKASDEEFDSKVGIRDRYVNKVKELGGEVTQNKNTKEVESRKESDKKLADNLKGDNLEERRENTAKMTVDKNRDEMANKFLAENGGTKAKASTEPEQEIKLANVDVKAGKKASGKKIPWDKNDVATGATWKNGAGQTIKSYKDKDGNIYIRGAEGKVTLFDAQGNPTKAAKGRYRSMAKAFKSTVEANAVANAIPSESGKSENTQTAMVGVNTIDQNTGMRMYPKDTKLER